MQSTGGGGGGDGGDGDGGGVDGDTAALVSGAGAAGGEGSVGGAAAQQWRYEAQTPHQPGRGDWLQQPLQP